ncbi:hypothetical protein NLI96_g7505 [Meripilus lineatus]|uniref:DUF6533 domain-containing protein n=1 Tax=Meripilus lineatus TaxID=2056292 RepID=A0AAD5YEV7_9APHY|nr:hypothetical protein NLI96_g7505 [Physisporinus lineatus]
MSSNRLLLEFELDTNLFNTLPIWDYLLTIHLEVDYMWPAKWTIVKVLFMSTRYLPLVDLPLALFLDTHPLISVETCHTLFSVRGWSILTGISTAENSPPRVILALRTWAIWERGKRIGYVLVAASIGCLIPSLVFEKIFLDSLIFAPNAEHKTVVLGFLLSYFLYFPEFTCFKVHTNPCEFHCDLEFHYGDYFRDIRDGSHSGEGYRVAGSRSVIAVLYRDGFLYFCYLFCITFINIIVTTAAPGYLAPANLLILQRVMHSCLTARVLLNLRKAHKVEIYEIELSERWEEGLAEQRTRWSLSS